MSVYELTAEGLQFDVPSHFFKKKNLLERVTFLLVRIRSPSSLCKRSRLLQGTS